MKYRKRIDIPVTRRVAIKHCQDVRPDRLADLGLFLKSIVEGLHDQLSADIGIPEALRQPVRQSAHSSRSWFRTELKMNPPRLGSVLDNVLLLPVRIRSPCRIQLLQWGGNCCLLGHHIISIGSSHGHLNA